MESTENQDLVPSLIETLRSSDLAEIVQDFGEVALDSILDDDLVKEVPVIGTIVRLGKVSITIRDRFLVRKVLLFLEGLSDVPQVQRKEFLRKIEDDDSFEKRVGETLIMLLDRCDHLDKPRLMSKLFSAYIKEEIDYDEFLRYSIAIDRAFIKDLDGLLAYFSGKEWAHKTLWQNLYSSGLSKMVIDAQIDTSLGGGIVTTSAWRSEELIHYSFNSEAEKFAKLILGDKFDPNRLLREYLKGSQG
jgi:hypothetical protein